MKFDWLKFCNQYHIPYVTSGPNTARGNISVQCPWCGESDPSQHLGLSLKIQNPVWGCFRNPQHRGLAPRRLVQRLLQCSYEQATNIVKLHNTAVPDDFESLIDNNFRDPSLEKPTVIPPVIFPKEFRSFQTISKYSKKFLEYVSSERGFGEDAEEACQTYNLHYALTGDYAWRIIIPVYDDKGVLRNWVGRAISPNTSLRYKNLAGTGKDLLFNEHRAREVARDYETVFVVEGPWDCMKIDFYGKIFNYRVTCVALLGTSITREQVSRVALLGNVFEKIVLLMDPEAADVNVFIEDSLAGVTRAKVLVGQLPPGVEDPGALIPSQVDVLCKKYSTKVKTISL